MRGLKFQYASALGLTPKSHRLRTMRGLKSIVWSVERIYRVASFAYDAWIEMSSVMTRPSKRFVASFAYDAWIEIESRIKRAANIIGRIVCVRCVD